MNECLENWNNDFLNQYFEQFQSVCKDNCCDSLLIPVDTSGNEFRKQRSLMYTYEVYNPYTNKTEMVDLSPAINVEIPISDKVKKDIIKPCEGEREKAKKELYALIPDKKTEILAANFAETLKREKMAQWLAKSKNSDAGAILDKVRFAQPVKISKRNFIAKQIKMAMRRLPSPERALKYAAVISAFVVTTGATTVMPSLLKGEKEQMSMDFPQTTFLSYSDLRIQDEEVAKAVKIFSEEEKISPNVSSDLSQEKVGIYNNFVYSIDMKDGIVCVNVSDRTTGETKEFKYAVNADGQEKLKREQGAEDINFDANTYVATRRKVSIEIGGKVADTEVVTRTLSEDDAEVLVGTWKPQLNDSKER
jgi:hypothetical protein